MSRKILLNWCPPSMMEIPSPSMSVLKAYLNEQNFQVEIKYWNILLNDLQQGFIWNSTKPIFNRDYLSLLLFYNYLAFEYNDPDAYSKVKSFLMSLKPQYLMGLNNHFFDDHMKTFYMEMDRRMNECLDGIDFENISYIGFSANIYQWICTSIIAKRIKDRFPDIPVVLGGMGTKNMACSLLENFPQFDIATWGEGEYIIVELSKYLDANSQKLSKGITEIPNVAVRLDGAIECSAVANHNFADLSQLSVRPFYDDYFEQIPSGMLKKAFLPIEGGRGCHWKKCNFCYLNTGYKYRIKSVPALNDEIRYFIGKYSLKTFSFLDNDVIANDFNRFDELLDCLIGIKEEYPDFKITMAEIITMGLTSKMIKKMALAGFDTVQIGYESPSSKLLTKINKKNTFASNLFFIKFAIKYGIQVEGANVIKGLIGETEEDVVEGIENLKYLRFFLSGRKFYHNLSTLGICNSSRNFESINNSADFKHNIIESCLPKAYLNEKEMENCFFTEKVQCNDKVSWFNFPIVEEFYHESQVEYSLTSKGDTIIYKESLNKELINELEFLSSSVEWTILNESNDKISSYSEIKSLFPGLTDCDLSNIIEELKEEGLLYTSANYSEMVSIIDASHII